MATRTNVLGRHPPGRDRTAKSKAKWENTSANPAWAEDGWDANQAWGSAGETWGAAAKGEGEKAKGKGERGEDKKGKGKKGKGNEKHGKGKEGKAKMPKAKVRAKQQTILTARR